MRDLDKEFLKSNDFGNRNYAKGISKLKKYFDIWVSEQLHAKNIPDFKLAYFPFIYNIDLEGTTTTELARRAYITKQGMGQVVKELEERKYIKAQPNPNDKRSSIIHLTDKGKEFVLTSRECSKDFQNDLQKLIGKKRLKEYIDTSFEILNYSENLMRKKK